MYSLTWQSSSSRRRHARACFRGATTNEWPGICLVVVVANRRLQVEWLLRKPITSEGQLTDIMRDAVKGERYLSVVRSTAERLRMRRGAISRAALPFDDHTSLSDQSNLNNRKGVRSIEVRVARDVAHCRNRKPTIVTARFLLRFFLPPRCTPGPGSPVKT